MRNPPRQSVISLHGVAAALLGLCGLAGCAENVYTPPTFDLTGDRPTDGGGGDGAGASSYTALIEPEPYLSFQSGLAMADQWRERPRDASLAIFTDQQPARGALIFSAAPLADGAWVLARMPLADATMAPPLGQTRGAEKLLVGQANSWFAGDLLATSLVQDTKVRGRKLALYFSATGSSAFPQVDRPYVSQIGLMTSDDGISFNSEQAPVITPPSWGGAQAPPLPLALDSHGATDPSLVSFNGQLLMFYSGLSCDAQKGCQYRVLQRTTTDGVNFGPTKLVLESATPGGVAGPSALVYEGKLLLAYATLSKQPTRSREQSQQALLSGVIGLRSSTDGTTFTEVASALIEPRGTYAGGVGRPFLYQEGSKLRLLFNGTSDPNQAGMRVYRATVFH